MEYAQSNETALICLVAAILMVCALLVFSIRKANIDYCPIAAAWIATTLFTRSTGLLEASVSGSIMTATLISFYVLGMLVSEAHAPAFFSCSALPWESHVCRLWRVWACADWAIGGNLIVQSAVSAVSLWALAIAVSTIFFAYLRYSSKRLGRSSTKPPPDEDRQQSSHMETVEPNKVTSDVALASEEIAPIASDADPWNEAFDMLVQRYGLSDREAQIVREFAAGRSARYLAEWYALGAYRQKRTCVGPIRRLACALRQELIDAIEEMHAESFKTQKRRYSGYREPPPHLLIIRRGLWQLLRP